MNKIVSIGFSFLSLLYILFALTIKQRALGAFASTGLGPKTVPLVLGILMFVLSIPLVIRALRDPQLSRNTNAPPSTNAPLSTDAPPRLVPVTIVVSVLFIVLLRSVGFILIASALLFVLVFLGRVQNIKLASLRWLVAGLFLSAGLAAVLSWACHGLAQALTHYGHAAGIALLSNNPFLIVCELALTAALTIILFFLLRRYISRRFLGDIIVASLTSVCATQSLYLVFSGLFLVGLPSGVLTF